MTGIPSDPIMLYSWVNTNLRDYYPSLRAMCEDLGLNESEICDKLKKTGFKYLPEVNQFR